MKPNFFKKSLLKSTIIFLLLVFMAGGFALTALAQGQCQRDPEVIYLSIPIPGMNLAYDANCQGYMLRGDLGEYIGGVYKFFVGIAGIVAVVMISLGGFIWLFSGGSPDKISKAKELILGAIFGLLLALGSYLILYTINPELINLKLNIPGLPGAQQTGPDPIGLPCTTQSECAPGFCDILSRQSVGTCKLSAGTCQKPADCSSNICNIPSGSTIGACTPATIIPPP